MHFSILFILSFYVFVHRVDSRVFSVAAYLPDYRNGLFLNASLPLLTDLIVFSMDPQPDGGLDGCCLGPDHFEAFRQAREYKQTTTGEGLRLWLSVGGFGRSDHFNKIVSEPALIKALVTNLLRLCKKEGLDGVDFDWEQPSNQEEFVGYLHLVHVTTETFHKHGLLVSLALHKKMYVPAQIYEQIDRLNLMTYDLITGDDKYHAALDKTVTLVKEFLDRGVPADKILLGIPMYARGNKNYINVQTMDEIVQENGVKVLESSSIDDMHWESPELLDKKVQFAVKNGLNGVFFWEIGQDYRADGTSPGVILEGTYNAIEKYTKKSADEL